MKALITIEFEGLCYYTMKKVKVHKVLTYDSDNYQEKKTEEISINDGKHKLPSTIITALYQASEYVSRERKFLDSVIHDPKKELHCILDWEVTSIQNFGENTILSASDDNINSDVSVTETPTSIIVSDKPRTIEAKIEVILPLIRLANPELNEDNFRNDFMHTFYEMKESIKDLSMDKQFEIVLSAMGVGYAAATTAMQFGLDLLKSIGNPDHIISSDGISLRSKMLENQK